MNRITIPSEYSMTFTFCPTQHTTDFTWDDVPMVPPPIVVTYESIVFHSANGSASDTFTPNIVATWDDVVTIGGVSYTLTGSK
jgi:hypothetical protein